MAKLNDDVLFLIIEKLQYYRNSLFSCLLVNRTWCKQQYRFYGINPFKFCSTDSAKSILSNVIFFTLIRRVKRKFKEPEN